MITYKMMDASCLELYGQIPMILETTTKLEVRKTGRGLGGVSYQFEEKEVPCHLYNYDAEDEPPTRWRRFDLTHWAFFMAFDGETPVGGATVAARTEEVRLLDGRSDMVTLWDFRVAKAYQRMGIGRALFLMAIDWSRQSGYKLMKIECQNTNPSACRFYEKQGAELVVNEYAYGTDETLFLWYLPLTSEGY